MDNGKSGFFKEINGLINEKLEEKKRVVVLEKRQGSNTSRRTREQGFAGEDSRHEMRRERDQLAGEKDVLQGDYEKLKAEYEANTVTTSEHVLYYITLFIIFVIVIAWYGIALS